MEQKLTHHTSTAISVICNGALSHTFDLDTILALSYVNELPEITDPQAYGRVVYQALFPSGSLARRMLDDELERILLVLDADDLDAIGWEYAYGPYADEPDDYLVSSYHMVRGLPSDQRIAPPTLDERLHIVAVPSAPLSPQIPQLNVESEWLRLKEIIGSLTSACLLERTRPPSLEQLRRLVANQCQRVVHFMGHGGRSEQGTVLYFEQENGEPVPISARECVQRLSGTMFLITLNACATAAPAKTPFGNLAAAFMRRKTPYTLGMRLSIADEDARTFSRAFYSELASGTTVEEAVRQARLAFMKSKHPWVIGVPVLYTALAAPAAGFPRIAGTPSIEEHQPHIEVTALPHAEGTSQGRSHELIQLGTWLTSDARKRIVTIHGGGGQGKTALAREAVERFAYTWPDGVWATSLERIPSRVNFLIDLAQFLHVPLQEVLDDIEVERRVLEALGRRRVLIVLDNAETMVEAVLAKDAAAIALAQLLQQLPGRSVSLIITSRVPLGWNGEELLELGGLAPSAGAELFMQGVPRRRKEIDRVQAWKVSERLEGHPFGLRLLSSTFDQSTLSVDDLLREYADALLKSEDIYQHSDDRHRTLTACLEMSVRYLDAGPRTLLSGLWIFHASFMPETAVAVFDPACQESEQERSPIREHLKALWERGLLVRHLVDTSEGMLLFYHVLPTTRPYVEQRMEQVYEREDLLPRFGAAYAERARRIHAQLDNSAVAAVFAQQAREDFERGISYTHGIQQGNYLLDWGWSVYRLGYLRNGLRHLEEAQEMAEGLDQQLELRTVNTLALVQDHVGLRREALTQLQRILPIRQALQDRDGEASTRSNIGLVYSNLGQPREALHSYEQALLLFRELNDHKAEGTVLHNIAHVYNHLGQPQEALTHYRLALAIEQEHGSRYSEAITLNNMAGVYSKTGQTEEALRLYEQVLPIMQDMADRAAVASVMNNIAAALRALGRLQEALRSYQQTLALRQEMEDLPGEATSLTSLGAVYFELGQPEQALQHYQQALSIRKQINDRVGEATTLHNMAEVYKDTGQPRQALQLYHQALPLRKSAEDREGEMATRSGIAQVYNNLGEPQKALLAYDEAIAIAREIGNRAGETSILNNIALVYSNIGQPSQALDRYEHALVIQRAIGDRLGEANTLNNIATVYEDSGQLEEALRYYEQALTIRHEAGDRAGEAVTLNNIGTTYRMWGKPEEALKMYRRALPIMHAVNNRVGEAATLNNMALILRFSGQLQAALDIYQQAISMMREVEDRASEAATLNNIAKVYEGLGKREDALLTYEHSLQISRAITDRASEATILNNMAAIYKEQGNQPDSLHCFEQALSIRREIGDRAGEASTLSNLASVYGDVSHFSEAIASCEQALAISRQLNNREMEAIALNNLAFLHKKMGRPIEALALYLQALPLLQEVHHREGEAAALSNIADILYDSGQLQDALILYEQALTILDELEAGENV